MLKDRLKFWKNTLKNIYSEKEIESIFFIFIWHKYNISKIDFLIDRYNNSKIKDDTNVIKNLKKEKPIQYILGKTEFMGKSFLVNKNTLIPRPETQELINWIIEDNKNKKNIKILDIGTGSGIIAINLALNLDAEITAIDICQKTLIIAQKNSKNLNAIVNFQKKNILKDDLDDKYDIIVSNPPYILKKEKKFMKKNVLNYEPYNALFVPNKNPLIFYENISKKATKSLKNNGNIYFEINENFGYEITKLLENMNFKNIEIKKDFLEKERMIKCSF